MRKIKELLLLFIVIAMLGNIRTVTYAEEIGKPYTCLPTKETITVDEETYINIGVGSDAESISQISSKSKKLIVKLVRVCTDPETGGRWYTIDAYSKHEGIYKIGYTYTAASGKQKRKTLKV